MPLANQLGITHVTPAQWLDSFKDRAARSRSHGKINFTKIPGKFLKTELTISKEPHSTIGINNGKKKFLGKCSKEC